MTKRINPIGETYEYLTIIERGSAIANNEYKWKCRCACGAIVEVRYQHLKSGNTKSCNKRDCPFAKETRQNFRLHLIGKKFGNLTIINRDTPYESTTTEYKWKCQCACGRFTYLPYSSLVKSENNSCRNPECPYYKAGLDSIKYIGQQCKESIVVDIAKNRLVLKCSCGNIFKREFKILDKPPKSVTCKSPECPVYKIYMLNKLLNRRYGHLVVIGLGEYDYTKKKFNYICKCDCGEVITCFDRSLYHDDKKVCGTENCIYSPYEIINGKYASRVQLKLATLLGIPKECVNYEIKKTKFSYYLDMAYPDDKIAIEYDCWKWHDADGDAKRDAYLFGVGWKILRIKSEDSLPAKELIEEKFKELRDGSMYAEIQLSDWKII